MQTFRLASVIGSCWCTQTSDYERRLEAMRESEKPKDAIVEPELPLKVDALDSQHKIEALRKQNETLKAKIANAKSSKENLVLPAHAADSREKLANEADSKTTLKQQLEARDQKIENLEHEIEALKRDVEAAIVAHTQTLENPICTNKWCRDCIWRRSCEKTREKSDKKLARTPTAAQSGEPIGSAETQKSTSQQIAMPTESAPKKIRSKHAAAKPRSVDEANK